MTDLGAGQRRAGHRIVARESLRAALKIAQESDATALAQRGVIELELTGARPRRELRSGLDALTSSERRIATLAADGFTNRQIAERLFLTKKTVEMHLGNTYRKLNITTRQQLPATLANPRQHND